MNSLEKYYTEKLYPIQDGVLNIVKKLNTPFYLTGGTALSRGYFHHRYSDDLDLFVNQCAGFARYVQMLFAELEARHVSGEFLIDYNRVQKYEHFAQFFIRKDNVELKIDLVNDTAPHYGDFTDDPVLGALDGWRNILSNKLAAVFRYEAKDIVDIWITAKRKDFGWVPFIEEAKTKEAAVDPVVIYNIFKSFPDNLVEVVKWAMPLDAGKFKNELGQIADDILKGNQNSLSE
jgi:hypothetical protein